MLGTEPVPDVVDRYVAAHARLLAQRVAPRDAAVLAFLRRHPRAVGPLDAAAGLLRPRSLLRRKLLLLTAILEATTTYAPRFLERRVGPVRLVATLAWLGSIASARIAVGVPLLLFVERRGR